MTNYDRIRNMSVEEMAEFIVLCDGDRQCEIQIEELMEREKRAEIEWLLEEVE